MAANVEMLHRVLRGAGSHGWENWAIVEVVLDSMETGFQFNVGRDLPSSFHNDSVCGQGPWKIIGSYGSLMNPFISSSKEESELWFCFVENEESVPLWEMSSVFNSVTRKSARESRQAVTSPANESPKTSTWGFIVEMWVDLWGSGEARYRER